MSDPVLALTALATVEHLVGMQAHASSATSSAPDAADVEMRITAPT